MFDGSDASKDDRSDQKRDPPGAVRTRKARGIVGFTCALADRESVGRERREHGALMGHFYKDLKAGKPKVESLWQAALALKNDGKHSHPYHWAPFILVGDGR